MGQTAALARRGACEVRVMRPERKQILNAVLGIFVIALTPAPADGAAASGREPLREPSSRKPAGVVALGESSGGITDRAYVAAPPNWAYVLEREAGSFLDCGEGTDALATDADGRGLAPLQCGVTLTETIFIPAAAASARIIVHF